jgi:antitoxin component of MazEF toxin-antitoxin module
MATIQYANGSFITTVPKDIVKALGAKKGDRLHFNLSENGEVKVIRIKEDKK